MKFGYDTITIDEDGIYLDGHKIDGHSIAPQVTVHRGGPTTTGPAVTLTLHADQVTITEEAKHSDTQAVITETWGDQE